MHDSLIDILKEISSAVFPIVAIVLLLQFTFLDMPPYMVGRFLLGAVTIIIGLGLFLFGVKISILPMGEYIGSFLPEIGSLPTVLFWVFFLGLTATLAEPPVRVLAILVEHASEGEIGGRALVMVTALGIGLFIALAFLRIAYQVPLPYLFWGGYILILALSLFIPLEFAAISFDASGVTTGPVSVPVILSLGVGVTRVLGGKSTVGEGFGLVGIASMGPILLVMIMGGLMG